MSKGEENFLFVQCFFCYDFVEWLYMGKADPLLFIIVQEDLFWKLNVQIIFTRYFFQSFIHDLFQLIIILYHVQVGLLLFLFHLFLIQVFKLNISNPEQFKLILNISFFGVMNKGQINQMVHLLFRKTTFLVDVVCDQHYFCNIDVVFLLFGLKKIKWIFFNGMNELLEWLGSSICYFDRSIYFFNKLVSPLRGWLLQKIDKRCSQQSQICVFMVCVNILNHHKWHSQFKQSCIEQITHFCIF